MKKSYKPSLIKKAYNELSFAEFNVLIELIDIATDSPEYIVSISIQKLSENLRVKKSNLLKYLKKLESLEYIKRKTTKGKMGATIIAISRKLLKEYTIDYEDDELENFDW